MSRMENKFDLTGNLGSDAEIRFLPSGDAVASVSLAVSNVYIDRETKEKKETTEWFRLTAFGRHAEFLKSYGKKGANFRLTGHLKNRQRDHKTFKNEDGTPFKIYTTDLIITDIGVNKWAKQPDGVEGAVPPAPASSSDANFDQDIPF